MGIKNFSKIFNGREIKMRNLKELTGAVDASVIAYQAALGMKNINALTDDAGNPTIHINVVIAKCLNFHKAGIEQVWVFDFNEKGYTNPSKAFELDKRKKIKDKAQKKLTELRSKKDEMFSSDDDEEDSKQSIDSKIQSQEKIGFSINDTIVNDIKFILDCFNIPWCESPRGYEAEAICAFLTDDDENDEAFCDFVWTTDTDAIIYGAKQMVRELKINKKKTLMLYERDTILNDNELTMNDLRKIAVIAGCDHCDKTLKVGPKTVLKKFKGITLTDEQKTAIKVFEKSYDISQLKWHNKDDEAFDNDDKIKKLLDWLECKNFNIERIMKQIAKATL
jgi:5'-3' exonuclease